MQHCEIRKKEITKEEAKTIARESICDVCKSSNLVTMDCDLEYMCEEFAKEVKEIMEEK